MADSIEKTFADLTEAIKLHYNRLAAINSQFQNLKSTDKNNAAKVFWPEITHIDDESRVIND